MGSSKGSGREREPLIPLACLCDWQLLALPPDGGYCLIFTGVAALSSFAMIGGWWAVRPGELFSAHT